MHKKDLIMLKKLLFLISQKMKNISQSYKIFNFKNKYVRRKMYEAICFHDEI